MATIETRNELVGVLYNDNNLTGTIATTTVDPTYALAVDAANKIEFIINTSNYQIYARLRNKSDGIISTSNTIDLPIESMVVNGAYDSQTKEVVLTLNNGNTVRFSVADLVAGLQAQITTTNKLNSDLVTDENQTNKFVTATEKTNWNAKEDANNKVTTITSSSTNTQYPSAKAVYDVIPPKMSILSYGHSTWADFLAAYQENAIVYCRAASGSDPGAGSQTRMAFMAYVNNADNPTEVEFQYYRSMNSHTVSQQMDQVFIYKLGKTAGWTVTTRNAGSKVVAGTGLASTYSTDTITLNATTDLLTGLTGYNANKTQVLKNIQGTLTWVDE